MFGTDLHFQGLLKELFGCESVFTCVFEQDRLWIGGKFVVVFRQNAFLYMCVCIDLQICLCCCKWQLVMKSSLARPAVAAAAC